MRYYSDYEREINKKIIGYAIKLVISLTFFTYLLLKALEII